ncbi:YkyB family protein [Rummeliibacillus sp. G93]|uniref:YkyB family protein n=1 Tax=Rummeliibacillus TaxID=648802 RepID=UPI00116BAE15|nr:MULTISPECIES: YkyB family protein [Rummeliibacillus]MBB5170052.1 hypothetical protein [Rummeliibacillus stabekisii]UQW98219.1 YkyB family protein [Rummeliibacillus sp. G93]GEL04311.1 hypothetical protein RST01_09380 [Rummeliibacillus stabekisii]
MSNRPHNGDIATAIYIVNKHAKTAPDNKTLYTLKRLALDKMIKMGCAKKIGLQFVKRPRFSQQQSAVVIQCSDYYFHSLPKKEDFKELPHLGHLDENYRNPRRSMSLSKAKQILTNFLEPEASPSSIPKRKKRTPRSIYEENRKKGLYQMNSYFYGH